MLTMSANDLLSTSFIVALIASPITGSYGCPTGCVCRGRPEERDAAVCYRPWKSTNDVMFVEPIKSLEFRHLLFQDMIPYLSALRDVSAVTIYPPKKIPRDNPLPANIFTGMESLETLTIHPTGDRYVPPGLARAIAPLTGLKIIDVVGNMLHCDCTLPKMLSSRDVYMMGKLRMPAVRGCRSKGFRSDLYKVDHFLRECATRGNYRLQQGQASWVNGGGNGAQANAGHRTFANVRDRNRFNTGVQYQRINTRPVIPSRAQAAPNSFSGIMGGPSSGSGGDLARSKALLAHSGLSRGRTRTPPRMSLADIFGHARRRMGSKPGSRRLLALDDYSDDDIDIDDDAAGNDDDDEILKSWSSENRTEQRLTEETMTAARPREDVKPNVNHGSLAGPHSEGSNVAGNQNNVLGIQNDNGIDHAYDTDGDKDKAIVTVQLDQEYDVEDGKANELESQSARHEPPRHRNRQWDQYLANKQVRLAMYQLPSNDLTIRLNPFDPFEVDLFFQYILHEKNLPGYRQLSKP